MPDVKSLNVTVVPNVSITTSDLYQSISPVVLSLAVMVTGPDPNAVLKVILIYLYSPSGIVIVPSTFKKSGAPPV